MGFWAVLKGEEPNIFQKWKYRNRPGEYGEYAIGFALSEKNLKGNFAVVKNIYLPIYDKTTEIDLVLVHEKGIFVIESKNYRGEISGTAKDTYWVQQICGKKVWFYSPLLQNQTHIKALAKYLKIPAKEFVSCVVFSQRGNCQKSVFETERELVLQIQNLLKVLRKRLKKQSVKYTLKQVEQIASALQKAANISEREKKNHIQKIQQTKHREVCPLCGRALEHKIGKYGEFFGCSGFPVCEFTQSISHQQQKTG